MNLTTGIERIRVRNYRVLRDVELDGLAPVTALIGPNGSGKSTVFGVLAFLAQSFQDGLVRAWDKQGGLAEIGTRGADDPVEIELTCVIDGATAQYRIVIVHEDDAPVVAEEKLTWRPADEGVSFDVLEFRRGSGFVSRAGDKGSEELGTPDLLGVSVFGQFKDNREIMAFHGFVSRLRVCDLDLDEMRKGFKVGRVGRSLSSSGRNIGVVVEYLRTERPDQWAEIVGSLRRYVPELHDIEPFRLGDGSWIVRLREEGGTEPIPPENISDGTLRLLGYLVALRTATSVLLVEEPENQVHPRLHYLLAEDLRVSAEAGQVFVATHAPQFVDALRPDEVWMMFRDEDGSAGARRASEIPQLMTMVDAGGLLGNLWSEGFFDLGDPLARQGRFR